MSDGWHDDPLGRYPKRYYDGAQWTHHVADHSGATQVDPHGIQPSPAGSQSGSAGLQTASGSVHAPRKSGGVLRFLARLIDGVIVGVPLSLVIGGLFDFGDAVTWGDGDDVAAFDLPMGAIILNLMVFAAYEIYMVGTFGRTIGKMVVGVTVVQAADGSKVDYGIAAVRFVAWFLYYIPLIGWILFLVTIVKGFSDPKGQTIHDSIAKTMVASSSSLRS
jgi:uncharacterized RDD family membrane protein YckC